MEFKKMWENDETMIRTVIVLCQDVYESKRFKLYFLKASKQVPFHSETSERIKCWIDYQVDFLPIATMHKILIKSKIAKDLC